MTFDQHAYGSARFATAAEIRAAGLFGSRGPEFGHLGRQFLRHWNGGGARVTGGSGSGKSSQILLPAILGAPEARFVVLDFKNGEISRIIEPHCALAGIPFYSIDPYGVTDLPNQRVSLLSHLTPGSAMLVPDSQRFWRALLPDSGGDGRFFDQTGRRFGDAITRMDVALQGSTSFTALYSLMLLARADFNAFLRIPEQASDRLPPDVLATCAEMRAMYDDAARTFESVMAGLTNSLAFMADPNLQATLVDDSLADAPLSVIADPEPGPVIVSLILPDELLEVLAPMVRAFISAIRTAKKARPDAPPVHLLIDEAARMGRFEELAKMVAVDRAAGIVPWLFYQDDGQIARNLGPTGKATLEANAALMLDLGGGIRDYETARARSETLGHRTLAMADPLTQTRARAQAQELRRRLVLEGADPLEIGPKLWQLDYEANHRTLMRKALMEPEELLSLPADRMLVQARGYRLRPFLAGKRPYFTQARFAGRFFPNPNEDQDLGTVRIATRWGMRRRRIVEAPLPDRLQHLPQYAGGLRPFRHVEGFAPAP
ncbi:type IV secretory system conjugative DNA transfer family protein [Pontivivens ytuae]|uniref:Type IV secretory system conjugative DNA transfer family protein n=1 Tax=Pontivivens ytuae TaxID=2789856 RepID=A0A7S9LSV9_9RHOB|nr:type IV secretory system conjugative DNA transfer family protein [Pontivivens ytuae]QPH54674.1 type IV secretory system conjugative DNA transfer family protein [Pontivivens ytuae]